MINVVIADDHALVREGIRRILEDATDIHVTGEAADGNEAIEITRRSSPNVVVMDLAMPNLDGIEATKRLLEISPSTRIVILSVHGSAAYARRLLNVGASAYVPKVAASNELIEAVRAAYAGRRYIGRSIDSELKRSRSGTGRSPNLELLTERETEVARLLANGGTNAEIAQKLGLSHKTISTHRMNILSKLRLRNNADLTRFAIANNLLESV